MSLANRVKTRRLELNLTQTQVAKIAETSQQSIEAIENGKTKKPRNILGLAKVLQCDPSWLVHGGGLKPWQRWEQGRFP